jgi:hypothetical protein
MKELLESSKDFGQDLLTNLANNGIIVRECFVPAIDISGYGRVTSVAQDHFRLEWGHLPFI